LSLVQNTEVTLAELVRLALPRGTRVLAGERNLNRRVSWARVLRARPLTLSGIEEGELVVVTSAARWLSSDSTSLARLIFDLAPARVAGFVVEGDVPRAAVDAAETVDMPLLVLPSQASALEVEQAVARCIVDRQAGLRQRVEEVYNDLLRLALEDAGVEAIAQALADRAGRSVAVVDEHQEVQALAHPVGASGPWVALVPDAPSLVRVLTTSSGDDALWPRDGSQLPPVVHLVLDDHRLACLVVPMVIKGTVAGHLSLLGAPGDFQELDYLLAQRAAGVFAIELARQRAVLEAQMRLQGDFLEDLLAGNFGAEEAMLARARHLGHDLRRPHVVVVLGLDPGETGRPGGSDPARALRPTRRFLDVARRELRARFPTALFLERGDLLSALIPFDSRALKEQLEEVRVRIHLVLGGAPVSLGVGRYHEGLSGLASSYREAERALAIGQRMLGGNRTVAFDDLGIYRILFPLVGTPELEAFCHELVGALEAYDRRHGAELLKTLAAFFACNGNHVQTARMLHLHRNTLLYRLDRIREIAGVDLDDPETRLSLQVALKALQVMTPSAEAAVGESAS
jgi:purine catabolism regulator